LNMLGIGNIVSIAGNDNNTNDNLEINNTSSGGLFGFDKDNSGGDIEKNKKRKTTILNAFRNKSTVKHQKFVDDPDQNGNIEEENKNPEVELKETSEKQDQEEEHNVEVNDNSINNTNNTHQTRTRSNIFKSMIKRGAPKEENRKTVNIKNIAVELHTLDEANDENDGDSDLDGNGNVDGSKIIKEDIKIDVNQQPKPFLRDEKRKITVKEDHVKFDGNVEISYTDFISKIFKSPNTQVDLKNKLLKSFNIDIDTVPGDSQLNASYTTTSTLTNSLRTTLASRLPLVQNNHDKKEVVPSESESEPDEIQLVKKEIEVKHEWFHRSFTIVKLFFRTEYRLFTLFIRQQSVISKTNILSLIFIRLIAALSICALLSSCNSISGEESQGFTNRNMAVAIITIFLIEIPFTFVEIILCRTKILINTSPNQK
jgi:hypothetical protein